MVAWIVLDFKAFAMHLGDSSVCRSLEEPGAAVGSCTECGDTPNGPSVPGFLHTLGLSTRFVRSYVQNVRLLFELFPLALFRFGSLRVLSGKSGERKEKGKKNNERFPQSLQTTGIPFPVFSAQRNGFSLWISDGHPNMHGPWGSAPLGWTLAWRLGPERRERKMGNPTACAVSWHLDAEMPRRFG